MPVALIDTYSDQEFTEIVKKSLNFKDCLRTLGYSSDSGASTKRLKQKIKQLNIDISHFTCNNNENKVERTKENVFCKNSTCSQSTLRKWYKKENIEYICTICGQKPEWNGKPLTLILDHIDGDNKNDQLDNLRWVCPNCNMQLDTTNARNPHRSDKFNNCDICGRRINYKQKRCKECAEKYGHYNTGKYKKDLPVTREELKNLIRNKPFRQIGIDFKISDNGIRKWCKRYNLPFKAYEIKKIPDSDWEKI